MAEKPLVKQKLDSQSLIKAHTLGVLVVAFLLVKVFLALVIPSSQPSLASDLTTGNIINAINEQRSLRNLVTLNTNSKLTEAAQSKSDDMQARHYFAHVDPDGHYIWDKIVADGYTPYLELGENIAIEFYDTDSLINAWMNSPEHRENILNAGFQDQGMGLTFGDSSVGQYHSIIDNTFGTLAPAPKPKAVQTPVKAEAPPAPVVKTPPSQTLGTKQTTTNNIPKSPAPIATTTPQTLLTEPIFPRSGTDLAQNNPQSNFSVPLQTQNSSSSVPTNSPAEMNTPPVIGTQSNPTLASYQANRYLVLFAGIILLLLMLSDIRKNVQLKLGNVDKKIGNLVVLILSLIVIAFMYWL
jgi:uncharacterized protein YkwD